MLLQDVDAQRFATELPRSLWVELTSKCPFDCVFCSRKTVHGDGAHMPIELFRGLLEQLRQPEIIRLNYSGESTHHPDLIEAIRLARATGAATELVTAFGSLPDTRLEGLATAGLDRLTVSLHAMDPRVYRAVYRFGSIEELRRKLEAFLEIRDRSGLRTPAVDFAFVVMQRNLHQLEPVAAYARELGIAELAIHPVIRRDAIPETFDGELDGGGLRPAFQRAVRDAVARVQRTVPEVQVHVSTTETETGHRLGPVPRPFPGRMPPGARIAGCEQNPWESVHVLANGDVVVCEVRDKTVMGNLRRQRLDQIWNGTAYQAFRRRYTTGEARRCRECPYKLVHVPAALSARIHGASSQLVRGWYEPHGDDVIWSKREALALLANPARPARLRLCGILPHADEAHANRLDLYCNGVHLGAIVNDGSGFLDVDTGWDLDHRDAPLLHIELRTTHAHRPSRSGASGDVRELGFALSRLEAVAP